MDRLPDQGRRVQKSTNRVVEPSKLRTCRVAANRTAVGTAIKPREGVVIARRQGRRLKGEKLATDITQGSEIRRVSGRNREQLTTALRQVDCECVGRIR